MIKRGCSNPSSGRETGCREDSLLTRALPGKNPNKIQAGMRMLILVGISEKI